MTASTTIKHAGEQAKLNAHAVLESQRAVYVNQGRREILKAMLLAGTATADDVRLATELSEGIAPVCLGAVPGPLARAGIIRRAGFAKTARPTITVKLRLGYSDPDRKKDRRLAPAAHRKGISFDE